MVGKCIVVLCELLNVYVCRNVVYVSERILICCIKDYVFIDVIVNYSYVIYFF